MSKIVGIDLGTTNSCVAVIENGEPIVIPNAEGARTTPSIVGFTEAGERRVGQVAKRQAVTNARNTIYGIKRMMGRAFDTHETRKQLEHVPYEIVATERGDAAVCVLDQTYTPQEISAMVLETMRAIAESYIGSEVTEAVVTVPAYFDDAQRQATKAAGKIAGLEVKRIINEPTAAAIAYGFDRKATNERIVVYDLGGGTFDISILELSDGVFSVRAVGGDTYLGGEDFDDVVIDYLAQKFEETTGIDLLEDRIALQRLKEQAERARHELSSSLETEINLPFIASDQSGPKHLVMTFKRHELELLVEELVDRTLAPCEQALKDANLTTGDIDQVILVGGMTRMPLVQRRVADFFEREPCKGVHPDEVVALGAAIQGVALTQENSDLILLDVTPHTLGIMVVGGYFEELIPLNTTVPTSRSKVFTTIRDNQTAVKILVMQGESHRADENELLGEFILTGLRRAPAGQVEVEVTFEINSDGIVSVHAKDLETGQQQSITVTATSGLTKDEIQNMVTEAKDFAVARRQDDESEQILQEAKKLIAQIEALFPDVEQVVAGSDFGRDAIDKARGVVNKARSLIEKGSTNELLDQIDALARTQRMFRGVVGKVS